MHHTYVLQKHVSAMKVKENIQDKKRAIFMQGEADYSNKEHIFCIK